MTAVRQKPRVNRAFPLRTPAHPREAWPGRPAQRVEVDYLLEHHAAGVRGALIGAAMTYRDTGRTHCNTLVALLQEGRAAMTYEQLAADLPEPPEPFTVEPSYDVDWAVDRRDLLNWVR